jgi:transcriptional regulator, propionate catabolism operon regulatory protein
MPFSATRPVIWAFSTSRLRHVFTSMAPFLADVADVRVFDRGFEDALRTAREMALQGETADAFVAAGANGTYLRDHAEVPVVVVMASTVDALQALVLARKLSPRIGVVNFQRVVAGLDQARHLLGDTVIEQRPYLTPEDARAQVADLAAQGVEVIVGTGPVCDLAERAGLRSVLLYGQDSVAAAVHQAAEIARIARGEATRREEVRRTVEALETGVAAVDADGRVRTANAALLRMAGLTAPDLVGRPLSEVLPGLAVDRVLQSGTADHDAVERVGNHTVVVSRIPLLEHGVIRGATVTCHDSAAIQRMERRLRSQHRPRRFEPRYALGAIVGSSPAIRQVRTLAERYARTDATVLITGESGTGKEMVAQGIHGASRRRDQPFVAINCAAFPETLLESELFGYEEGAFTGSRRGGRPGLFEAAHLGTIFLDEVGDVPVTLQTRLLRVLQEKQVLRLGSNDPTPVDVRVVAATHRDLRRARATGEFREDLYYRLHILPLHIPPLRDRPGDVAAIAAEILKRALVRHGAPGMLAMALAALLPRLEAYAWPGNVRELENVLERVALLFADDTSAAVGEDELAAVMPELFESSPAGETPPSASRDLRAAREAREREHVLRVLAECRGNQSEAARRLGIGRSTLYRKLASKA